MLALEYSVLIRIRSLAIGYEGHEAIGPIVLQTPDECFPEFLTRCLPSHLDLGLMAIWR